MQNHRLKLLRWAGLACLPALAGLANAQSARYTNTAAHMTAYITNQMALENVTGIGIALLDGDTTVWARGFGYADREAGMPVGTGTVFRIGSVSKVFATTAILKLVDDALVDLDAPVTNYIPAFATLPRFAGADPITVRMLLAHQSGLPGDILYAMFAIAPMPDFLDWLIAYLRTDYPAYPSRFVSVYCNTGFVLAEGVVRAASGMDFTAYAQASIFGPLGMPNSSFLNDRPAISNNLAHPYIAGIRMPDEYIGGYGTGGMYASMPDLIRYLRMVNAGGVLEGTRHLSTNALAEMTTDNTTNCPMNLMSDSLCGLGWDFVRWYELDYAGRVWIKSGGTLGYTAYIIALPDQQLAVAVAANTRCALMETAVETLRWAVLDKTDGALHWPTNTFVPPNSPITNRPQSELDDMAGIYVTGDGLDFVTAGAGTLTWTQKADTTAPVIQSNLMPRANGWFSNPDSQIKEMTVTNRAGETVHLIRAARGAYQHVLLNGQRYTPTPIPAAWRNRTNTLFLADDIHPLDYIRLVLSNYAMKFSERYGILHHACGFSNGYLDPHDDDTAFVLGLQNRGPAAIQAAHVNGVERLQCGGYNFIDAAAVPTLAAGGAASGTLRGPALTDWYRMPVRQNLDYVLRVVSADHCNAIICDPVADAVASASATNFGVWRAASAGYAYAGIYGDGHTAGVYAVALAVASHGGHDFDGDGRADPALAHGSVMTAWLSGANYTHYAMDLGESGRAMLAADVDGDGKADPVVVRADGTWQAWLSAQNYATIEVPLGTTSGTPLLADCDGDGRADLIVVLDGRWYVAFSTENYRNARTFDFGLGGGRPLAADFDGDGKADPGMVNGFGWQAAMSANGYALFSTTLDRAGIPCPGDYDGDGKADPAVFDDGWQVWLSGGGYQRRGPFFSGATGVPVP